MEWLWKLIGLKRKHQDNYCSDGIPHDKQIFSNDDETWVCRRCGTKVVRTGIFSTKLFYSEIES